MQPKFNVELNAGKLFTPALKELGKQVQSLRASFAEAFEGIKADFAKVKESAEGTAGSLQKLNSRFKAIKPEHTEAACYYLPFAASIIGPCTVASNLVKSAWDLGKIASCAFERKNAGDDEEALTAIKAKEAKTEKKLKRHSEFVLRGLYRSSGLVYKIAETIRRCFEIYKLNKDRPQLHSISDIKDFAKRMIFV